MEIDELLDMYKCDCGRSYCEFFAPGLGDWGSSFSRQELEALQNKLPALQKHLDELLAPSEGVGETDGDSNSLQGGV